MSQSLSSILVHLVFSTKNREPFITPIVEAELHPYMAKIFREMKCPSLAIDAVFSLTHSYCCRSSRRAKNQHFEVDQNERPRVQEPPRQRGYGAFSIGQSNVEALKRYIHEQKKHHQRISFEAEYRKFLKAYGIDYDERYVWD